MYDPEMRKDCPMRGNLGNCSPVGGFCMDAVSDEICEAVHNAYDLGFYNAVRTVKEHESKTGHWIMLKGGIYCSECHKKCPTEEFECSPKLKKKISPYCPYCGILNEGFLLKGEVKWDG